MGRDPSAKALIVRATERPNSPVLERFLEGYDRAFVLSNEREETEGFRACLSINPVARHCSERMYRGLVMVIGVKGTGKLVGEANFLAARIEHASSGNPPTAVAHSFLYVEKAERGC